MIHDNRGDSRTAYDNHSSGTHSHYAIYNTGNHVQPSGTGTYVHHTGDTHEHHGVGFSPQNDRGFSPQNDRGFSPQNDRGFSPQNDRGEHGGFGGRR